MTSSTQSSCSSWFFIQSFATEQVIAAHESKEDAVGSQVILHAPQRSSKELWQWDGHFLRNQETQLVLDISEGRLRLIKDTNICLQPSKPIEQAQSQRWGVKDTVLDSFGRQLPGTVIYSLSNEDWVLDIKTIPEANYSKLILSPDQATDNAYQLWSFIPFDSHIIPESLSFPESPAIAITSPSSNSSSPYSKPHFKENLPDGLSGAANRPQGATFVMEAYKESHQMVFLERNPHLSDKTIAMAAAYQAWQSCQHERTFGRYDAEKARSRLLFTAENEAARIFDGCDQLNNHKVTAISLATRLAIQLYEQFPHTS